MLRFPNYANLGDIFDFYHLLRLKGPGLLLKHLNLSKKARATSKWDTFEYSETDFWVIPEVQKRWNKICTGDENTEYEDYLVANYLTGLSDLKLLSVGCGYSAHEPAFARHACFASVEGIDISEKQLELARQHATKHGIQNLHYRLLDFEKESLPKETYDVVLFHSSLHHFNKVHYILKEKTLPLLKKNGLLVLVEYTGPNRLQWTNAQLEKANSLLKALPAARKTWLNITRIKKKVYRPGLLRMWLSDPSEAADSESILDAVHKHFELVEEKKLGCNLIHPLLKGISQHFTDGSKESRALLDSLFREDEKFTDENQSDFTFGIYRKR